MPESEIPLTSSTFSIPDSELHHIRYLTIQKPADCPDLHEMVEQLCDPVFQLVMDVTTLDGTISCACTGCAWPVEASAPSDYGTEVWISSTVNGSGIIAFVKW